MAIGFITRRGAPPTEPFAYTYTGESILTVESEGVWNIKFLTSGTLTVNQNVTIDAFLCGGGGGGGAWNSGQGGAGGGGGYTYTRKNFAIGPENSYPIVVGAGGAGATGFYVSTGGNTSAFGNTANGAGGPNATYGGGNGGSGGCGSDNGSSKGGGTNGGDGAAGGSYAGGYGQGSTTKAFGDASEQLFASGGSFVYGVQTGASKDANSGDGGDGGMGIRGGDGGSGIAWIRSAR